MALKKAVLDVPVTQGLEQKFDPRKLPLQGSASAFNLIKTKQSRLDKRLGMTQLTNASLANDFSYSQGVALATYNDNILEIGQGAWAPNNNAKYMLLGQYLDDAQAFSIRGIIPECTVDTDSIISNDLGVSVSPTIIQHPLAIVAVWLANKVPSPAQANFAVYWCSIDPISRQFIHPPAILDNTTGTTLKRIAFLRLALVGTTVVCCYSDVTGNIYAQTMPVVSTAQQPWTGGGGAGTLILITNASVSGAFDMRSVTGDPAHFVVALAQVVGGVPAIGVVQYNLALVSTNVVTVFTAPATSTVVSFGLRADATTINRIAIAFTTVAVGAGQPFVIDIATVNYATFAVAAPAITVYTGIGSASTGELTPRALAVALAVATGPGAVRYVVSWSPFNSAFNYGGTAPNTLPAPTPGSQGPNFNNNARIMSYLVRESGGTLSLLNLAGIIQGLHLSSQHLEANGMLYVVGWVPSYTQGTFIVMCLDWINLAALDSFIPNQGRPVATFQLRTALYDPSASGAVAFPGAAPNTSGGLSEFSQGVDLYATACVSFVASSQGQRLLPAYGLLRMAPRGGYPSAAFGNMLGIGGGLPTIFDGAQTFEQGFLYGPENVIPVIAAGNGPRFVNTTDTVTYICTYEHFDTAGNFHISGRSPPVTITGATVSATIGALPRAIQTQLFVPTYGPTMRDFPVNTLNSPLADVPRPTGPVIIGIYRTAVNGSSFIRIQDRYFNQNDGLDGIAGAPGTPVPMLNRRYGGSSIAGQNPNWTWQEFVDSTGAATTESVPDTSTAFPDTSLLSKDPEQARPLLYTDGSGGLPGNLDNLCPPATTIMARHKERLFVARGNLLMYTKGESQLLGPGYYESLNAAFVGGNDPITGLESMDDKLAIFKAHQIFFLSGDGPNDDGGGNSFSSVQPIPTDLGCVDPRGVRATPEGVYFMSTAGLRILSRNLSIEYAGAAIEDDLAANTIVTGVALYPRDNRVVFAASVNDTDAILNGVLITRDYVLDAWTDARVQMMSAGLPTTVGAISVAVANAMRTVSVGPPGPLVVTKQIQTFYILSADGTMWREQDPLALGAVTPYWDTMSSGASLYVPWVWQSPWLKPPGEVANAPPKDQGWMRVYEILAQLISNDPHGLTISVAIDYGTQLQTRTWAWNSGPNQIAPLGQLLTAITQIETYDGRRGESFQVTISDIQDVASVSGRGASLLGLTLGIGVYEAPMRLPARVRQ
jgi:hypothetical protein